MCYSAEVWADYRRYVRAFSAELSIGEFHDIFWRRNNTADASHASDPLV